MRVISLLFLLLLNNSIYSQTKQNLGITVGTTFFKSDTEAFYSSTVPGLSVGLLANFEFNRRSELTFGLKYNRHVLEFDGRRSSESPIEKIRLNLKQLELPVTFTYNFVSARSFSLGLNAGASANLFYEYRSNNEAQEEYILEPNGIRARHLFFGTEDQKVGFNVFLIAGLDFKFFDKLKITPRYYHGTFNPYRQVPEDNPLINYESDLSYFFVGIAYFF